MASLTGPGRFHVGRPFSAGLAAGVLATAALGRFERLEHAFLHEEPPYAPARVARRLFGARRLGPLLRWTYGPSLGVLYAALRSRVGPCAVAFGAAIAVGELLLMPLVGALPPLRRRERVALFAHAIAFALAAEAALRQARSASPSAITV
ncbi:MAG TPA: hypothetical protein VE620_13270 [Myxococcales bacterium]|nr:hypothetical protein [Myxococcales bacterium]